MEGEKNLNYYSNPMKGKKTPGVCDCEWDKPLKTNVHLKPDMKWDGVRK